MVKVLTSFFTGTRIKKEVDLLIEQNNQLYPVEFKKTASPSINGAKHFVVLKNLNRPIGPGAVICLKETDVPLSRNVTSIPVGYL